MLPSTVNRGIMLCTLNTDQKTESVVRRRAFSVMFNMVRHGWPCVTQ